MEKFKAKGDEEVEMLEMMTVDQVGRAQSLFCTIDELLAIHTDLM